MTYYIATIQILVDTENEAEASDLISETLREHLREFTPESSIIDWRYSDKEGEWRPHDGSYFEYA